LRFNGSTNAPSAGAFGYIPRRPIAASTRFNRQQPPKHVSPLFKVKFWRVVLDEAQRVENPTAQCSVMAAHIEADHRWCVTGTPIGKGGVNDLRGLLTFLHHATFGGAWAATPSTRGVDWWKAAMATWLREPGIPRVVRTLRPLFWRRLKAEVLQALKLPTLSDRHIRVDLSPLEWECLHRLQRQLRYRARALNLLRGSHRRATEAMLLQLRQACCHPLLSGRIREDLVASGDAEGMPMQHIFDLLIEQRRNELLVRVGALAAVSVLDVCVGHNGACHVRSLTRSTRFRDYQLGAATLRMSGLHRHRAPASPATQ